jgi:hypothetical protein
VKGALFFFFFNFHLNASTTATYIFIAPNCTTIIIILELCALNAGFQYFILRFDKKFIKMIVECNKIKY